MLYIYCTESGRLAVLLVLCTVYGFMYCIYTVLKVVVCCTDCFMPYCIHAILKVAACCTAGFMYCIFTVLKVVVCCTACFMYCIWLYVLYIYCTDSGSMPY